VTAHRAELGGAPLGTNALASFAHAAHGVGDLTAHVRSLKVAGATGERVRIGTTPTAQDKLLAGNHFWLRNHAARIIAVAMFHVKQGANNG
jgi:hypothetical protein